MKIIFISIYVCIEIYVLNKFVFWSTCIGALSLADTAANGRADRTSCNGGTSQ